MLIKSTHSLNIGGRANVRVKRACALIPWLFIFRLIFGDFRHFSAYEIDCLIIFTEKYIWNSYISISTCVWIIYQFKRLLMNMNHSLGQTMCEDNLTIEHLRFIEDIVNLRTESQRELGKFQKCKITDHFKAKAVKQCVKF